MPRWLCLLVLPLLAASNPELAKIKSVYLLPMVHGLDQYLAARLSSLGVLRVVTDPSQADAVFTDQLGEAFEKRLKDLYASPPARAAKPAGEETAAAAKQQPDVRISSWTRGHGNVFLVDPRTRAVIWSAYQRPRDSSPDQLNRAAQRIAERLKRDLKRN